MTASSSAISIIRVSGDGQDETLQRASCQKASEREGLTLTREIQLHAVSGYKGDKRHLAALADALSAVRSGEVSAIVVAHSSRASRLDHRSVLRWMWDLQDAGGRIVSHDEANWAGGDGAMDDAWAIMTASQNHTKSKDISLHVNRAHRTHDALGYFRGSVPGGYETWGPKGAKHLRPHPAGGPEVIEAFLTGKSTPAIARTFAAANERYNKDLPERAARLRLPESPRGVASLLRHPVYSTGKYAVTKADGTAYVYKTAPLISPGQQRTCLTRLQERHTGDNVSTRAISRDDYSGALWCAVCGQGRLYRYWGGGKRRVDGTAGPRVRRYACDACGKSVRADDADQGTFAAMYGHLRMFGWYVTVPDDPNADRDRRVTEIDAELEGLPRTARVEGWTRGAKREHEDKLYAERDALAAVPDAEASYPAQRKYSAGGRALTEGDRWQQMTPAGQRDYLACGDFRVLVKAAGNRSGAVTAVVEDHRGDED